MVSAAHSLAAQDGYATGRGSMIIGGSANFTSSQSGDNGRLTTFGLQPSVQYFVSRGLALGGSVSFDRSWAGDQSLTSYGLGPVVSCYFPDPNNRLYPFLSLRAGYLRSAFRNPGEERDGSGTSARAAGGVLYMLSASVGINSELFYQSVSQSEEGQTLDSNAFGLAVGITAFIF
jgi:hypothetical protein